MRQHRWSTWALVAVILCHVVLAAPGDRFKRQSELSDNPSLDPNSPQEIGGDVQTGDRPKRKLEGVAQIGFEAKNAVLGFLFGKINQLIDSKTRLVAQLDQTNIAKNKQYGIEAPGAPSFGGFANVISSGISFSKPSFGTARIGGQGAVGGPVSTTTDDTPIFDRAKVSLDIPDELFGSSVSLVTNISKVVGEVIMNSARRTSDFLQLFKPIFGSWLKIKGVDLPPPSSNSV